jgi:hypothetical protein
MSFFKSLNMHTISDVHTVFMHTINGELKYELIDLSTTKLNLAENIFIRKFHNTR